MLPSFVVLTCCTLFPTIFICSMENQYSSQFRYIMSKLIFYNHHCPGGNNSDALPTLKLTFQIGIEKEISAHSQKK